MFAWDDKLRIYQDDEKTHVHTHAIVCNRKGQYQIEPEHFSSSGLLEAQFLDAQVKRFAADGAAIGAFAKLLVSRYGFFSIRRLWQLRGVVKEFGSELVNSAAPYATSLHNLKKIIKIKMQR